MCTHNDRLDHILDRFDGLLTEVDDALSDPTSFPPVRLVTVTRPAGDVEARR